MSVDAKLEHVADIQRARRGRDSHNTDALQWPPNVPDHLLGVRGRLVHKTMIVGDTATAQEQVISSYRWLMLESVRGVPLDVRIGDRIVNVRTGAGRVDAGPYRIDEIIVRRRAGSVSHLSLLLERLT